MEFWMYIIDDKPDMWPYALASLLLHALIIVLFPYIASVPEFKEDVVEVFPIFLKEGKDLYRIADIAEPEVQIRPESAKFLGMYDSAVDRESVSAGRPLRAGGERMGRTGRLQKDARGGLFAFDRKMFLEPRNPLAGEGGEAGMPEDFYPDFRRDAHTYLNVLRYPGVEYFVRMKRAFKITFDPVPSLRSYFSANRVALGSVDVVLGVSVDEDGELAELFIFRSSGIPAYDDEALRTVRASAPFATPPDKFLGDDGLLRMSWTFSVYL